MNRREALCCISATLMAPIAIQATEKVAHIFEIEDGELHWYAAYSAEHAKQLHIETNGLNHEFEKTDEWRVTELDDDQMLEVNQDCDMSDNAVITRLTVREWIAKDGIGPIATTCW